MVIAGGILEIVEFRSFWGIVSLVVMPMKFSLVAAIPLFMMEQST